MNVKYILIICIGIVVLYYAQYKLNLRKTRRQRQFLLPFAALAYCAYIMYKRVEMVEYFSQYATAKDMLTSLTGMEFTAVITAAANIVLLIGFLFIKQCLLPVINRLWISNDLTGATSGWVYEDLMLGKDDEDDDEDDDDVENKDNNSDKEKNKDKDSDKDKNSDKESKSKKRKKKKKEEQVRWVLQRQFEQFRIYIIGFYIALAIATTIIFIVSLRFPQHAAFQAVFYPIFGVLILGEVVAFLSGPDRPAETKPVEEKAPDLPEPAYDFLRKILRKLFKDRDIHDVFTPAQVSPAESTYLQRLDDTESHELELATAYFNKLASDGEKLDPSYVQSAVELVQGKSTLINNPFYKDLTHYMIFPMLRHLMNYRKCLIVIGRESVAEDVKSWVEAGLLAATGTNSLWDVEILTDIATKADIGILKFSDIYHLKLQSENRAFLKQVGFVLIIEPSHILATAQMGLSLLVTQFESNDIVYCACDRNCDGLVDALSHTLKTNITEVTATQTGTANCSEMYWNADGEYLHHALFNGISRYLGIGTEIASVAAKHLYPAKSNFKPATWISCNKFPVIDMKWIAGQYYAQICQYADMVTTQETFNHNILTVESNLWQSERQDCQFYIVEDEFQNLFEMKRVYSTRAMSQLFINVISENYFLRDYMVNNVQIFENDPKAIPTFVPDFARTERNVILKLIMLMAHGPVAETLIRREFMLSGIDTDAEANNTYEILQKLIERHCHIKDTTLTVQFESVNHSDGLSKTTVKYFRIDEINAISAYAKSLSPAYFLAEDELGAKHYIHSRLYGHVFQTYLPGQFTTFEGKYYEVRNITPQNGVVLRRAADHIHSRTYYRQIRTVHLESYQPDETMAATRIVSGLEITNGFANFTVKTAGYIETKENSDLKHAQTVLLNGIPDRSYHNKGCLRIKLPGASSKVIYTICLLLNEIFRTTYPDAYPYVYAVTSQRDIQPSSTEHAMYHFEGPCEDDVFYIFEDSEIDLGLIVSLDRNMKRYFEMICDVLTWHLEKMTEIPVEEEDLDDEKKDSAQDEILPEPEEEKSFFQKVAEFFKRLFGGKEKEEYKPSEDVTMAMPEDDFEPDESDDDNYTPEIPETTYQKSCFLKYGDDVFDDAIDPEGTIRYLSQFGYHINPLQQARQNMRAIEEYAARYNPQKENAHFCDFCGCELDEVMTLPDGRERCEHCADSEIKSRLELRILYEQVRRNMERIFHIEIDVPVAVKQVSAREMAKISGTEFKPTPHFDARAVGFAQKDENGYAIWFENHAPRIAVISTIVHELTHIWQFSHWESAQSNDKELTEGMAMWAEIQYLFVCGEREYAARVDVTTSKRKDVYGRGYRRFVAKFPMQKASIVNRSPFEHIPPM